MPQQHANTFLPMNRTIMLLLVSDIFVVTGFGLIEPILAVFITEDLAGGTLFAAGMASAIFLLVKSLVQLPFSRYVDRQEGRLPWLIGGTLLVSVVPFLYLVARDITTVFIAQVLFGIGSGLAYPTWLGLWSVHLDRHHESYEWSLYSTLTGLGTAMSGALGAALAELVGFRITFLVVGALSLVGCGILFLLGTQQKRRRQRPWIRIWKK